MRKSLRSMGSSSDQPVCTQHRKMGRSSLVYNCRLKKYMIKGAVFWFLLIYAITALALGVQQVTYQDCG